MALQYAWPQVIAPFRQGHTAVLSATPCHTHIGNPHKKKQCFFVWAGMNTEIHTAVHTCTATGNLRECFVKRPRQTSLYNRYGPWRCNDSAPQMGPY